MRAGAASASHSLISLRKGLPLVGYTGNGHAHDERKQLDGGGRLSSGGSRDSSCRGVRRRVDIQTGTSAGNDERLSAGSSCCRGGSVSSRDRRRRNHLRHKSKHQLHDRVFRRVQFLRLWTRARCSRRVLALFRGSGAPRASGLGARRYRSLRSGRAAAWPPPNFLPPSASSPQTFASPGAPAFVIGPNQTREKKSSRSPGPPPPTPTSGAP